MSDFTEPTEPTEPEYIEHLTITPEMIDSLREFNDFMEAAERGADFFHSHHSPIPTELTLINYHIIERGDFPKKSYIAIFNYPSCIRKFDGSKWTVETKGEIGDKGENSRSCK